MEARTGHCTVFDTTVDLTLPPKTYSIHSPPEYALGDFSNGQQIIRGDDNSPHDVNQVSTGQRAALALSIFRHAIKALGPRRR